VGVKMMYHYINTDNKTFGFDETQTNLIPADAILIPSEYTFNQYPYLTLVDRSINYNKEQHDIDMQTLQEEIETLNNNKKIAIDKLSALGLTQNEINALIGAPQ
jgi:hypothetical protein